jgi:hypothetical protein
MTVSAVVAFRGWPGLTGVQVAAESTPLAQATARPLPPDADQSTEALVIRSPTSRIPAHARGGWPQSPGQAGGSGPRSEIAQVVPAPAHPPTVAVAPTGPVVQLRPPPTPPLPRVGEPVRKVGGGLGNTVQKTGHRLSNAVRPISPTLADAVDKLTNSLGDKLKGLGGGIAHVLDLLSAPRR